MTVPSNSRRREYETNGVTRVFNGPMSYVGSYIAAYLVSDGGAATEISQSSFNVENLGKSNGTRVTFVTAPPAGYTLTLIRVVPYRQDVDITNQGAFLPETVEKGYDEIVMQVQQLDDLSFQQSFLDGFFSWNALGLRIINVARPVQPSDAATKAYSDDMDAALRYYFEQAIAGLPSGLGFFIQNGVGAIPRTFQDKLREQVSVRDFGARGDGSTNDTAAFKNFIAAVPNGGSCVIPPGTYIVSEPLVFAQNRISLKCELGAVIKQASGTQTIDSLIRFTGSDGRINGLSVDANVAGNPGYTGRGQMIEIAGDRWDIDGIDGEGSQLTGFGNVLYVVGNRNRIRNVKTRNTGDNAIRCRGDYNVFQNIDMFDYAGHGFAMDAALDNSPFTYVSIEGVRAYTSKASATEAILVDPDGIQGGLVRVRDVIIDHPNNAHADVIKFAYCVRVEIDGLRCFHKDDATQHTTLRFQQAVRSVSLKDVVLPGAINFDASEACTTVISGRSVICQDYGAGVPIQGVWGALTVEDGVEIRNAQTGVASTDGINDEQTTFNFGRVFLHGMAGWNPPLVQFAKLNTNQRRRIRAGQVSVSDPLGTLGTMRSIAVEGRWIGYSETQDAASRQGDSRRYLASNSDAPPRDSEGWRRGDVVNLRAPVASQPPGYVCTTPGHACRTAWAAGTAYVPFTWVANGGNVYVCVTAGTSAGSGGPTGTGSGIVDGTAVWDYLAPQAVFKALPALLA